MSDLVKPLSLILGIVLLGGCVGKESATQPARDLSGLALATFAGGCFWCVEAGFEQVPGVAAAVSGYTGGRIPNPSYKQVASGRTGHLEAVQVHYDPEILRYETLLQAYWRMVDPTDAGGQFSDRGPEYATAIWYHTPEQRLAAERSKSALGASGRYRRPLVTPILAAKPFYEAEAKHQNYYQRHPASYRFYRYFSGRDEYLERTWGEALRLDFDRLPSPVQSS